MKFFSFWQTQFLGHFKKSIIYFSKDNNNYRYLGTRKMMNEQLFLFQANKGIWSLFFLYFCVEIAYIHTNC